MITYTKSYSYWFIIDILFQNKRHNFLATGLFFQEDVQIVQNF